MPRLLLPLFLLPLVLLPGCLARRVSIESDPPGALVYANDVELGRTPLQASFTYYGDYDVRIELDGYEPRRIRATASAPIYEYPPFDIVAMAIPADIEHVVHWRFKLEPALETTMDADELRKAMIERANALRENINR